MRSWDSSIRKRQSVTSDLQAGWPRIGGRRHAHRGPPSRGRLWCRRMPGLAKGRRHAAAAGTGDGYDAHRAAWTRQYCAAGLAFHGNQGHLRRQRGAADGTFSRPGGGEAPRRASAGPGETRCHVERWGQTRASAHKRVRPLPEGGRPGLRPTRTVEHELFLWLGALPRRPVKCCNMTSTH